MYVIKILFLQMESWELNVNQPKYSFGISQSGFVASKQILFVN